MESFQLESVDGRTKFEFRGVIPRGLERHAGMTFIAALAGDVSASVDVYDIQPQGWSAFFANLAEHWRGWTGAKEHRSLEGHLTITCTRDKTGHIELRIRLRGEDMSESHWRAEASIYFEAGQLESIARDAKTYFG